MKDAHAVMPDGARVRISPTAAERKAIRSLPEHFRTSKYGKGSRWRAGWYEPDGTERGRVFSAKIDAEAYLAELEDNIRSGKYAPPELTAQPFATLAQTWLASKRIPKAVSLDAYRTDLDTHILPKWGTVPINTIQKTDVEDWVGDLLDGTAPRVYTGRMAGREKKALSPSRVRDVAARTFGSVLRYAVHEGWIPRNPLARVEFPRTDTMEDLAILNYEEQERLARACAKVSGEHRDRALVHLLASSGPRIGEATAFQVGDVQAPARRIAVDRTWTTENGKRVIGLPKTWEERRIPVLSSVLEELAPLMEDNPAEAWLFRVKRGGNAVDQRNWRTRVWVEAVELADLVDERVLTPHKLRHTAASSAIAAGADPTVVQLMLGHRSLREIQQTYAHLWPDRLDEVLDAVEAHRAAAMEKAKPQGDAETPIVKLVSAA